MNRRFQLSMRQPTYHFESYSMKTLHDVGAGAQRRSGDGKEALSRAFASFELHSLLIIIASTLRLRARILIAFQEMGALPMILMLGAYAFV